MVKSLFSYISFLLLSLPLILVGCSTGEIQELQYSVQKLENKVEEFQHVSTQDTVETATSLDKMNKSLANSFRDIRYTQSNLETMVNTLSERMSSVEATQQTLQTKLNRLDTFATSSSTETLTLKKEHQTFQESIVESLQSVQNQIQQLSQTVQSIQNSQSTLSNRIDTIEANNREVYRKILSELGGPGAPESYSGTVHTVKSGETLSKIASDYDVSTRRLQDFNGISDPSKLQVGQKIKIPQ